MLALQLNLRIKKGQNELVPVSVGSEEKLDSLRTKAAELSNLSPCDVLLLFRGTLLQDTDTAGEVGLIPGDCVHCLQAKAQHMEEEVKQLTTVEALELHVDLTRIMRNRNRKNFLQHVSSREFSSQALTAVPEAQSDPEVLALVQDPVMLQNFCRDTPDALKEACTARPALGGVLAHLVTLHKTWSTTPSSPATAPTFSLDALYEQDDEFSPRGGHNNAADGLEEHPEVGPSAAADRLPVLPAITPAQLAAALANATGGGGGFRPLSSNLQPPQRAAGHPSSTATPSNTPFTSNTPSSASTTASHTPASASASTPHQQSESGAGGQLPSITSEMLQNALQSVLGAVTPGAAVPAPVIAPDPNIPNLEESVRLMAEMGIPDEALSRQALIMTNGDVQSAVEIVFAQLNILE